ncbi:hypothetical protein QQZ08_005969 [Neonectria magnoliae]|uniref:Uncharacterized protein n=1 Tax=Neonectria magnoliae TaxID=2732573 RepID=A0ABR1I248_9HYPO
MPEGRSEDVMDTSGDRSKSRKGMVELTEDLIESLLAGIGSLPMEVQRAMDRYTSDKNTQVLLQSLDHLFEFHALDDFLEDSPTFRYPAAEIFGKDHSYLKQLVLDYPYSHATSPSSSSSGGSFGPAMPLPEDVFDEGPPRGSLRHIRLSRRSSKTQGTHSRSQGHGNLPTIRLTGAGGDPVAIDSASGTPAAGADLGPSRQPVEAQASRLPVIHNFTISTRADQPEEGSAQPDLSDVEMLGDLPDLEPNGGPSRKPGANLGNWLQKWSTPQRIDTSRDVNLHDYKGWKIEAPKIQLIRAKNFLADEDLDRTVDWSQKFAELAEYFDYLAENFKGEDWGDDLVEARQMLHLHWAFEQYHYGTPELIVHFPKRLPAKSNRLQPLPGALNTVDAEFEGDDMGPRHLLVNLVHDVHDFQYRLPPGVSMNALMNEYEGDLKAYYTGGEGRNGPSLEADDESFNMVECENQHYDNCIQGGMITTSELLEDECKFQLSLNDTPQPSSEPVELGVQSLKSFAKFRGARRAALQQCLNLFDGAENTIASSPWRVLILPPQKEPAKPDPGIIWDSIPVENVPEKEARDPFGYTMAHKWYQEEDEYWAEWVRPASIKGAWGERKWMEREDPIMNLPANYKGPYYHDSMDKDMRKVFDQLRASRLLHQRLKRAQLRAPRDLLEECLRLIESGMQGEYSYYDGLEFRKDEIRHDHDRLSNTPELHHIRPEEYNFLHALGSLSVNEKMMRALTSPDPMTHVFEWRVDSMMLDINPDSLFRDTKPVTLDEFLVELNIDTQGPVKRHVYTREEAIRYLKVLAKKGVLDFSVDKSGEEVVRRSEKTFHPEDLVRWPSQVAFFRRQKRAEPEDSETDEEPESMPDTISTIVTIPKSEDFGDYENYMPRFQDLRNWTDCLTQQHFISGVRPRVENFFRCLAYRLGVTLRNLDQKHTENRAKLTKLKKYKNREFLDKIVRYWHGDADQRPNDPTKNPGKFGWDRITPKYRDVIRMAEPEAHLEEWGGTACRYDKGDAAYDTWEIVRNALVREAYENKSLLHATRVVRLRGPDGLVRDVNRREPVWSFAVPGRKSRVGRFWDMNRWPLHLQSEETQEKIRSSGSKHDDGNAATTPEPSPEGSTQDDDASMNGYSSGDEDESRSSKDENPPRRSGTYDLEVNPIQEFTVPFSDPDVGRRSFKAGPAEFWAGDTPLQRKMIEKSIRSVFEPPPPRRSAFSRFFGRLKRSTGETTDLPEVNPRFVPKSKPRAPSPVSEGGTEEAARGASGDGEVNEDEEDLYDATPPPSRAPPPTSTAAVQTQVVQGQRLDLEIEDPGEEGRSEA